MSSSSRPGGSARLTGRVIMSLDSPGQKEMSLQEIEGKKRPTWDASATEEYMARVRDKAQKLAADILARANLEAENIRRQAAEQGTAEGLASAEAQLVEYEAQMGDALAGMLRQLQDQKQALWERQKNDIIMLVRLTVEKTLGVEIGERRAEIMEALLAEALSRIDSHRKLTLVVSPDDAEVYGMLMTRIKERHDDMGQWRVRTDPNLALGGLMLESDEGLVDNSVATRWAAVEEILGRLDLPAPGAAEG